MKIKFLLMLVSLTMLLSEKAFSMKPDLVTGELIIYNYASSTTIKVKVYPIGAIFNGAKKYSPECILNGNYDYITGGEKLGITTNAAFSLDHDASGDDGAEASIGYGKYRVVFFQLNFGVYDSIDYCDVDYGDADYPYGGEYTADINFYYYSSQNIKVWTSTNSLPTNRIVVIWDQSAIDPIHVRTPNKSGFSSHSNYTNYPIFATQYEALLHITPGDINLNLQVDHNVYSNTATNITIKKKSALLISSNKTLTMQTPSSGQSNLIVEDTAMLSLGSNSQVIVEDETSLTLKNNSKLSFAPGSQIVIYSGGLFCNEGTNIRGKINLVFKGGIHQQLCATVADYLLKDSVKFILDTNAILSIPNNTTLHLTGNTTSLIMRPGSKLMFGENSGILCDSGAKIIANNATFTSIDSTKKWNGISLKHLSQDTIKNCTIKNANNGVVITNKYSASEPPNPYSTEVSGCSFVNQTNYVLNSGVYISGSNTVLIMNNTFTSNALTKGYNQGISAEYCAEEAFNIIGNTISNSANGITLISCSPFVAQNTINGNEYSESGIFLDNSNGTFEYNVINDFYYSYYSFYSSPDLLKNTFNNSYDENIYLSSSSAPVMHPIVSEGSTYWYSGDNLITGSPSDAGIFFDEDAYPDLNYGYNKFILTNNTYYINGINPGSMDGEFSALENFWNGTPVSNKFNVTGATSVEYSPYNASTASDRSTNDHTLYGIGFGLYDTVFFQQADNPLIVQELYLEAYQKEYSGEFSDAIEIYKDIVADYKDSSYAPACLSRIFNCYEKKNSTTTEFSSLESYYENIFNDTSYSEIQRNISEDFMIKSKVKQGNIEEAVSDYNTIYINNMNTPKGTHALINKEILSSGEGDNLIGSENLELKQNRINEILSNIIKKKSNILSNTINSPESFSLLQNYPNPFNPTTTISFNLSNNSFINLKVFDITGKEVRVLVNEYRQAGNYSVTFDAGNLPSGVYYYQLTQGDRNFVKRMVLLK